MGLVVLEVLYIVARLLLIAILLALIGKPLWFLYSKIFGSSLKLNFVQELVVDVCFGGFVLYILALIPLGFFNHLVLSAILVFCSSVSIYLIVAKSNLAKYTKLKFYVNRADSLDQILTLSLFLIALLIQCIPLTNFIFGSIHDTSLHALFTQLIIENHGIPETHQPYMPAAIIFPQGPHPAFAFVTIMTGMIPPLAVFHTTRLFNAMTVLAAYHFGKQFIKHKWGGLSLAFMFTFVSTWPFFITWGSNGFVLGFSCFFIATTFVKRASNLLRLDFARQVTILFIVGLFVGYLGAVHLSFYMVLSVLWLIEMIIRSGDLSRMRSVSQILFTLAISILLILPFVIRFICYYPLPGHNIGLPDDIESRFEAALPLHQPLLTLADLAGFLRNISSEVNVAPHAPTRFVSIVLSIVVVVLVAALALKRKSLFDIEKLALTMIFAVILIIFSIIMIPEIAQFSEYTRFGLILFIPLMSLLAAFNFRIHKKLRSLISKRKNSVLGCKVYGALLVLLSFTALYGPFVCYRITADTQVLIGNYNVYAATTQDDYDLMLWMRNGLSGDISILVNPFEAGLFIPSVSQKKIVYPFSAYHFSGGYSRLCYLLSCGILNSTTFAYLDHLNITHIYVGARKSNVQFQNVPNTKWDPNLFLGNPNFILIKRFGKAYLFKCNKTDEQRILADSFEYNELSDGGWQIARSHKDDEKGDCTISSQFVFDDLHSCRITFRSTLEPSWISMFTKIYISNPSNITVSFYIKQADGFGPRDALMFIISNVSWGKKICFTSGYVPMPLEPVFLPREVDGYFEFNVTHIWRAVHNEALPKSFFLQILSYDADRVENVAYVDAISVSCGENRIFADQSIIVRDDFEYPEPNISRWFFHSPEEVSGQGKVTTSNLYSCGGNRSLELKAQKTYGEWYWCSAIKAFQIYKNRLDVIFSFCLNASKGFGEKDAFMIVISDIFWRKKIYFSTNSEVLVSVSIDRSITPLTGVVGHFEFNINRIWQEFYSEFLPPTFYVQLMNYDSDGIQNIAYVDEIVISAG